MAKTTFTDKITRIVSEWLNEVNVAVFDAIGDGTNAPTTGAEVRTNIGAGTGDGDVTGPASSTTDRIVTFSDVTGKVIKDSGVLITGKANSGANSDITSLSGLTTPLSVPQGGTGRATSTTAYGLLAAGTTATGAQQTLAAGATTEVLVGGGASALPVWFGATGTGSPARAGTPTFTSTIGVGGATASGSGAGVSFPATQSPSTDANTLDDYEEGTYTPSLASVTGTLTTLGTRSGSYTILGNRVLMDASATITTNGTGATGVLIGTPFTIGASTSGDGRENTITGRGLAVVLNSSSAVCNCTFSSDNSYPGGDGRNFTVAAHFRK